jgi:segregation and condensation protein A
MASSEQNPQDLQDAVPSGIIEEGVLSSMALAADQASSPSEGSGPVAMIDLGGAHFFEVRLDIFDGPIDLLLHLVKQNELSIEKISLSQVTSQYLMCIEAMRYFDLEVAGEYLVIAATLLSIKSSILLNEPVQLVDDGDGNLIDPHEELLRKLREAAIYRDGARALEARDLLGFDVFPASASLDEIEPPPVKYKPHDAILLGKAFKKIIERLEREKPGFSITIEHVSIVERMRSMLDMLEKNGGRLAFHDMFKDSATKGSVVASFVAILELCKRQVIVVQQGAIFEEIYIAVASNADALSSAPVAITVDRESLSSEFDIEPEKNEKSDGSASKGEGSEVVNS